MMRRLTLILMTVLLAAGLVSCDLSAVMQKMGENIAGANPGKINAVTDKIDETWSDENSVQAFDSDYTLGGINLGQFINEAGLSGEKVVAPLSSEDFQELASSIGVASSTSQGSAALTKQLSKPLDTTEDSEKIAATKGTAEVFKSILSKMTGKDTADDIKNALSPDSGTGSDSSESNIMNNLLEMAVDGVFEVTDSDYTSTQGDLLFMQSLFTVVDVIGPQVFVVDPDDPDNPFAIRDDLMDDAEALNEVIDQANSGLQVIDAVAPSSAFRDIDISSLLDTLMSGLENSEGGSN